MVLIAETRKLGCFYIPPEVLAASLFSAGKFCRLPLRQMTPFRALAIGTR